MESSAISAPTFSALAAIMRSYRQAAGAWRGCDWPIRFGLLGLNLEGLESAQAALMAGATSGDEAAEWRRASTWLARVEQDAARSERDARAAVELASRDCLCEAFERAQDACLIEARYHDHLVWQGLRDALAACITQMSEVVPGFCPPRRIQ
jgi:hypothetical protein